jgi:hypothetical protein
MICLSAFKKMTQQLLFFVDTSPNGKTYAGETLINSMKGDF